MNESHRRETLNMARELAEEVEVLIVRLTQFESWARDLCRHTCAKARRDGGHLANCPVVDLGIGEEEEKP